MDAIYYISGFLIVLGIPAFVVALIAAIVKPHLVNNRKIVKTPMSRKRIATAGIAALLVSFISFSSVLAATEPASIKAERLAREAAQAKALQVQKQQQADNQKKAADEARKREEELNKPVVKTETKTEPVTFESIEQNDSTLPAGQKKLSVAGVNGERTITYSVTYIRDKETSRTELKNEITKAPVNQVTLNGTYVKPAPAQSGQTPSCPNGTYVNSAGNTVCRPYQSNSAPAGATAQCGDGTYSYSQSRRGTCSHHGGVARWL